MNRPASTEQAPLLALVVDDRPDVANGLAWLLRNVGCTVHVAYNAHDSLVMADRLEPVLVFLDIGLPDRSGHDVCKDMRQTTWGKNAFIVAVTGYDEPQDVIRCALTGFDRHVGKPMPLATLQEIMEAVRTRTTLQLLNTTSQHEDGSVL